MYFLRGEPGHFTDIVKAEADVMPRESQEQRGGRSEQRGGRKVAGRVLDSGKWWQYFEHSAEHNACCSVKARDVVGGGFTIGDPENGKPVPETVRADIGEVVDRSLEDLIDATRDWEVTGWCGLECLPTRNGRELYRLNHIDSWTLWPQLDGEGFVHARDHQKAVQFAPLGVFDQRNQLAWLNNNHWHKNTYYGVPDIVSVLIQIDTAWQALQYNRDFFIRRGGYRWMLIIRHEGLELDGMGAASAGDDAGLIQQLNYATSKAGKDSDADLFSVPIGSRKAELHKLDADVKDMDFPGLLTSYRNTILMAHAVPPLKAGIVETGALGGNVGQEQLRAYRDNVVAPKQRRWGRFLQRIIEAWWGVRVDFQFNPVELDELALLAPKVVQLFQGNIIDRDEARGFLGLPPVEEDAGRRVWGYEYDSLGVTSPDVTDALQKLRGEQ